MSRDLVVFWIRKDFRLEDNLALQQAVEYAQKNKLEFLPIFILDKSYSLNNYGYFRQQFLAKILSQFAFKFYNLPIFVEEAETVFKKLSENYNIHLFINELIEPWLRNKDVEITQILQQHNGKVFYFKDQILVSKDVRTGNGQIYSIFTPFKNNIWETFLHLETCDKIDKNYKDLELKNSIKIISSLNLKAVKFVKNANLLEKEILDNLNQNDNWILEVENQQINLNRFKKLVYNFEYTNEKSAQIYFQKFLTKIDNYKCKRDFLAENGTSQISIALAFGLINPRWIMSKIKLSCDLYQEGVITFINELIWREFYKYILFYYPQTTTQPFLKKYLEKPINWENNMEFFEKFIYGKTGYKIIDASLNQLNQTGWMHNRARMIVNSFLTKNLGINWQWGEKYFKVFLLDYDPASNIGGWQWGASVGADPKPVRIFNPYIQQKKFDPKNEFIQKWLTKDYNITEILDYQSSRQNALFRYGLKNIFDKNNKLG